MSGVLRGFVWIWVEVAEPLMTTSMKIPTSQNAGLYVHIPFCVNKCPYCDFYSQTDLSLKPRLVEALIAEMEMVSTEGLSFDTLYIGGGTPSVYDDQNIDRIVNAIFQNYRFLPDSQITIEVNPGTASIEKLKGYQEAGINRINIGVQSFSQTNLEFLGRIHTAAEACNAINDARRAGFAKIGLDFIYGLPEQTREDWLTDLEQALAHGPTHLSCYMLTYEKGTPLHRDLRNGRLQPLSDDQGRDLFETTVEFLEDNGFFQYEISNFARQQGALEANVSRHNFKYWTRAPYIGLGPSAHSFRASRRYWNLSGIDRYLAAVESGRSPVAETETLTPEQELIEVIYLGLRMTQGIDLIWFAEKFEFDFLQAYKDIIADLVNQNYLKVSATSAALTRQGRAFLDRIAAMLVNADVHVPVAKK
ncbi:MAG: radical SAM family heme chaperone HemW [Desulfobacterales bacterium]|nr:radical SAM family heme chaperone HemW [Desulfobacterales bacterium]